MTTPQMLDKNGLLILESFFREKKNKEHFSGNGIPVDALC